MIERESRAGTPTYGECALRRSTWVHPQTGEIQQFAVPNRRREIAQMIKRIRKQVPGEIHACYEAGVCGFVLKRHLEALGCVAKVIAPSLVLRKPGDRVKGERPRSPDEVICAHET